ncbi:hypothetical protein SIN8267_00469 [Sinobacterium norvegicum]|uniref:Transglycosylase SLT domain-containing protein n=1 Tax=Sinobacterium norvegicum TaxID=1641715 RepID=A0ABM9ABW0_9GAMM|nr:transglycosylase SLT domain-containing protein [Sinobacterium norvegicum]CAH0990377.1 hypothetical protein SIN8267_00469 [Sinobacterium norvegicum]
MNIPYLKTIAITLLLSGCATTPPSNTDNVCDIFEEKSGWYKDASKASKKWGGSIPTIMAFMHQESRFVHDARPQRGTFLWIFPGSRPSNALGYSQALNGTWDDYKSKTGNSGASRKNFGDAADFIAWYNSNTVKQTNIKPWDNKALYLAYHDGPGGYNRGTYKNKQWLINVSQGVADNAWRYRKQLEVCEAKLIRDSKFLWFF